MNTGWTRRKIKWARKRFRVPQNWSAHILPHGATSVQFQCDTGDYILVRNVTSKGVSNGIVTWRRT